MSHAAGGEGPKRVKLSTSQRKKMSFGSPANTNSRPRASASCRCRARARRVDGGRRSPPPVTTISWRRRPVLGGSRSQVPSERSGVFARPPSRERDSVVALVARSWQSQIDRDRLQPKTSWPLTAADRGGDLHRRLLADDGHERAVGRCGSDERRRAGRRCRVRLERCLFPRRFRRFGCARINGYEGVDRVRIVRLSRRVRVLHEEPFGALVRAQLSDGHDRHPLRRRDGLRGREQLLRGRLGLAHPRRCVLCAGGLQRRERRRALHRGTTGHLRAVAQLPRRHDVDGVRVPLLSIARVAGAVSGTHNAARRGRDA